MFFTSMCLFFLLCFIGGCGSSPIKREPFVNANECVVTDEQYVQEAMLIDIPIPLYTHCLFVSVKEDEKNDVVLGYQTPVSTEELIHFYTYEMERFGWIQTKFFQCNEQLMCYETPSRICIISLRKSVQQTGHVDLFIFTGQKQSVDE